MLRGYSWRLVSSVGAQERLHRSVGDSNSQEATAVVLNCYWGVEKVAKAEWCLRYITNYGYGYVFCEILATEFIFGNIRGYLIASVIEVSRLYIFGLINRSKFGVSISLSI